MQVAFYAIGDGAIERCLNAVETANGATGSRRTASSTARSAARTSTPAWPPLE